MSANNLKISFVIVCSSFPFHSLFIHATPNDFLFLSRSAKSEERKKLLTKVIKKKELRDDVWTTIRQLILKQKTFTDFSFEIRCLFVVFFLDFCGSHRPKK